MQAGFIWTSVPTVSHKRLFCCAGTTPKVKSTLNMWNSLVLFFFFDHKAFCVHTNTWIWNTMNTLVIKVLYMLIGTVYNKWGRCVSIKYSLLWYNHTKKNPVISWSKTLVFKWLYNNNKWNVWGILCIHTLLWLYTGRLVRYLHSRRLLCFLQTKWGVGAESNVCRIEYNTIINKNLQSNALSGLIKTWISSHGFPFPFTKKQILDIFIKAEK